MRRQFNYVSQPVMAMLLAVILAIYAGWIWLMPPVAAGQADSAASPGNETTTTDETMPDNNAAAGEPALNELTPEQYNVCFRKGTEPPGSGEYNHLFAAGTYHCAACSAALFSSETKYDSGSGWPAFYDAIGSDAVIATVDDSLGMRRLEVTCANCGAHLGHVFDDGPPPTQKRYCINSLAMEFMPADSE